MSSFEDVNHSLAMRYFCDCTFTGESQPSVMVRRRHSVEADSSGGSGKRKVLRWSFLIEPAPRSTTRVLAADVARWLRTTP